MKLEHGESCLGSRGGKDVKKQDKPAGKTGEKDAEKSGGKKEECKDVCYEGELDKCCKGSGGIRPRITMKDFTKTLIRSEEGAIRFTDVIVCEIPDSYAVSALGLTGKVDLALARKQHAAYVETLRSTGVRVKVLKADEKFPDCVFVEDAAVIVEGHALLTRPGDPTRVDEIKKMRKILRDDVGLPLMEVCDPEAKIDGGDVLFTGREILVGLSKRTNTKGLQAIHEAFPGFPVTGVEVSGPLHLKTLLSMCGKDTICASMESGDSITMLDRIDAVSPFSYRRVLVPDDLAANCIFMNDTLICKSKTEAPNSFKIFEQQCGHYCTIKGIENSEAEKAVGSLTCMSLRFNIPGSVKQVTQAKLVCRMEDD